MRNNGIRLGVVAIVVAVSAAVIAGWVVFWERALSSGTTPSLQRAGDASGQGNDEDAARSQLREEPETPDIVLHTAPQPRPIPAEVARDLQPEPGLEAPRPPELDPFAPAPPLIPEERRAR